MGERPDHQPQSGGDQRLRQRLGAGDIEDVLQPGESRRRETRVDQAVGQRIEFNTAPPGHHQQQEQALGGLLDHRSANRHRHETGLLRPTAERLVDHLFQQHRDQHGRGCAPEKSHHQQARRLRLPAVQPQVTQQHPGHRHGGQREPQGRTARVGGGQQAQDQAGQRAQRDEGRQWGAHFAGRSRKWRNCGIGRESGGLGHQSRVAAAAPGFVLVDPGRVGSAGTRALSAGDIAHEKLSLRPTLSGATQQYAQSHHHLAASSHQ